MAIKRVTEIELNAKVFLRKLSLIFIAIIAFTNVKIIENMDGKIIRIDGAN